MSYMTDRILNESDIIYTPKLAMIVYAQTGDSYYIESHEIDQKGRLGAGSPVSIDFITDMVSSFSQEYSTTPFGRMPENMLYADNRIGFERYIWYNPPQKRMMYFSKELSIPNAEYHIPGIIYVAGKNCLDLYAFKGNKPEDKLYKAPFFNTTDGSVCLGSVKLDYPKHPTFEKHIEYWEKKFWLTEFTHLGGSNNPTKHNLVTVTKKSKEKFNDNELVEMNYTLKQLLK